MKWLAASGTVLAGLVIAGVGTTFWLDGGTATMEVVPWTLVLLLALMAGVVLAGLSLLRAQSNTAFFVFLSSAICGFPLVLMWVLMGLSGD